MYEGQIVHFSAFTGPRFNMLMRELGNAVRREGGTYCYKHGFMAPGCTACVGADFPDFGPYVFGGLHKADRKESDV